MLHSVTSDLGLHFLPMSPKWDARLIWVNIQIDVLFNISCRILNGISLRSQSKQKKTHFFNNPLIQIEFTVPSLLS